jgi:hypothetical protein
VSAESGWTRRPAKSQTTVAKYMVRHRKPPSQSWRTFLKNHARDLVSADFFVVPTIAFQLLFVFVILDHDRRRPIHFAVTSNATAEWTAHQLLEAFPWDKAQRYLLRDRDGAYGEKFCHTAKCTAERAVCHAKSSSWFPVEAGPRPDPGRNRHGVRFTSLMLGQASFWQGHLSIGVSEYGPQSLSGEGRSGQ